MHGFARHFRYHRNIERRTCGDGFWPQYRKWTVGHSAMHHARCPIKVESTCCDCRGSFAILIGKKCNLVAAIITEKILRDC